MKAVDNGHGDVCALLICHGVVSLAYPTALIKFCEEGKAGLVDLLLQADRSRGVDPSFDSSLAFFRACSNGHVDVVELLIHDGRVEIGADGGRALIVAAENGYFRVVETILAYASYQLSPSLIASAESCAQSQGHVALVGLLRRTRANH